MTRVRDTDRATRTEQPSSPSACRYWLARRLPKPDGVVENHRIELVDGCHDGPEGVAEAAKLHARIFNDRGPWVMVEIHEMPDLDPPINEEAAAICAHLVMEGTPNA